MENIVVKIMPDGGVFCTCESLGNPCVCSIPARSGEPPFVGAYRIRIGIVRWLNGLIYSELEHELKEIEAKVALLGIGAEYQGVIVAQLSKKCIDEHEEKLNNVGLIGVTFA
jgi:hypothetical protein